ncbi:MAG TPA: TauD/TfdA family dioxygenase [Pyrinomonadaceae bacterium]
MNPSQPNNAARPQRKPVRISEETLITAAPLQPGASLPLAIKAALAELDLIAWATNNREMIESNLARHGGILFRGFKVKDFERFATTISDRMLEYRERSSPRSQVSRNTYTSTDYPPDQSIFLHNENSYQQTWPLKIFFYCETPASRGGETPIADCRKVYEFIHPDIRNRFAERGWMYVRNFSNVLGLTWQTVFQTDERSAVEAYCLAHGIETEWLDNDRLRIRARRRAIARHPHTHELVWFNHAAFFHVSTLERAVREMLLLEFREEDLPANTYYGDGKPIEADVIAALRDAYHRATVTFPWQRGDILLLDNMLVAHGRAPFAGPRRVLVAMAEPHSSYEDGLR